MSIVGPAQFKTGDQSEESRRAFVKLYFKQCVKCSSTKIEEERFVDGVRMNGDAYGTTVFTCGDCGWKTSFQYDDSSDCYYYETAGWPRDPCPVSK
jgi:hypothetical protein